MQNNNFFEFLKMHAKNIWKYEQMVTFFRNTESTEQLESAMLLFIFDTSYERSDIALAEKCVDTGIYIYLFYVRMFKPAFSNENQSRG